MVYFISGLGSDERLFRNLEMTGIPFRHIKYLTPLKNESLDQYTDRLKLQIDQEQEIILVGVSFGGIVAQELARKLPCRKVIIISSVKAVHELDWRIKLARASQPVKVLPARLLKWGASLTANYFFSIKNRPDAEHLAELIRDADPQLVKWSVAQVLNWKPLAPPENLVHLHGAEDRIFPGKNLKAPVKIISGGHFMIANQAAELSRILREEIFSASGPDAAPGGQ